MEPSENDRSYIEYKHVLQVSQQPADPRAAPRYRDGHRIRPHKRPANYSPLQWYYTQLAWGKICSFLQPMIGHQFSGSEILPGLWVSDHASVCNLQALLDRNISHVVCAVLGVQPMFPRDIQYTNLPLRDTCDEDIYQYFDTVANLIHRTLSQNQSILVHCRCGVSRSVTLVCAYLIKYKGMGYREAIRTVQERRSCANPIRAFRHQLRSYEEQQQQ